ncbi:MAG: prolyl aminopeptidase [Aestuariivirgaceae bacterium]|nr:prolyl aminopeptidase [Aestuariivirgaceae bacterium]
MRRTTAFPEILPYRQGRLKVSALHEIAYEECGNPQGKPVVVLHGGPGGGSNPYLRRLHDPAHYRIIQFDQRGCGASTPHAELEANTTWDLVADMEALRELLGISRWQVMGGSWGSTLALAYAQTHPERVSELILRGIFTLRRAELLWFYQEGASWLYPDAWEGFLAPIPLEERHDMMAAYYRRLTGPDRDIQLQAARAWSQWEGATLSLFPDADRVRSFGADAYALAFARIECHYFVNGGFFQHDDELLRHAHRLANIPGAIVHGRYDVVTPLATAHLLHKAWPQAQFTIVPDAGHASTEPGITSALIAASQRFKD